MPRLAAHTAASISTSSAFLINVTSKCPYKTSPPHHHDAKSVYSLEAYSQQQPILTLPKLSMPALKPLAIIAGVGPGTGSAVAHRFSAAYTVALLSRSSSNTEPVLNSILASGGSAVALTADVTSAPSIAAAFAELKATYPTSPVAVAVYNVASRVKKPFLELSAEDWESGWATGGRGAFLFSQQALPLLLETAEKQKEVTPTLIFTGATASITAYAGSAAFAAQKWAQRALAQSLAREFGPRGVHVAHAIIDGPIDGPRIREMLPGKKEEELISAEGIAEVYWGLHKQDRRALTWEVDVRTSLEKW
jgi:NAD(P)-dependent dehydrogenase (short-subunit alcohol dehydrogenase family)